MKSKSLKHRYYLFELELITKFFPFKSGNMPDVSLRPIRLLVERIDRYFKIDSNLFQNTNLSMRSTAATMAAVTTNLERLVKHCKKNEFDEKDRQIIKPEKVITYIFFTDESGNIINVGNYVTRIKEALEFLCVFYEKHYKTEGTTAYANCRTIFMHLQSIHAFIGDLAHVFLSKPIK